MKAQSDLAGDCKSAAEMTAPRICGVTIRMSTLETTFDHWSKTMSAFDDSEFNATVDKLNNFFAPADSKVNEVIASPPLTVTSLTKPRKFGENLSRFYKKP